MCPREHALAQLANLRRIGDHEALTQGSTFHYALEHYYRVIQAHQQKLIETSTAFGGTTPFSALSQTQRDLFVHGAVQEAEATAWEKILPMRDEPGYLDTYDSLERMLASYFDCYRRKDPWRILAVEENLEFWVRDDADDPLFGYTARLDLVVEDVEKRVTKIVEHKSARTVTEDLIDGYQLDQQILGQAWLFLNCVDLSKYAPFGGVDVNITTKHKLPRHERVAVLPSRYHLAAFQESITHWNSLEKEFAARGWPKALGNCAGPARYWSRCDFYNICHGMPEASVEDVKVLLEPPFGYRLATTEDLELESREDD